MIGTGASAIQFIPEIQRKAAHLAVFQRTPSWITPRHATPRPNTEVHVIPGAGHCAVTELPALMPMMVDWLRSRLATA